MKRFLVLTLVLSMSPLASAALSIGVNGDPDPVDSEITIAPSDTLILSIIADGAPGAPSFMLVVDNAQGTISGGYATPAGGDMAIDYYYYMTAPYLPGWAVKAGWDPTTKNGAAWSLGDTSLEPPVGVVFDDAVFHCESLDDAVIELWESPDLGVTWALVDTVTVHQPEPMTMALLGLGGLLVRRRRK